MLTLDDVIYTGVSEGDEFKLPAVAGVYKIEYKVEDSEGLEATVVRTITVAQPWDRPMDMKVEDGGWFLTDIDGEGRILITSEEGITSVEIVEIAPDDWRTGLGIGGINLLPGKYRSEERRVGKEWRTR